MIANGGSTVFFLACVASVPFGFGTKKVKKDQGTGFSLSAAREMEREPKKMKEGGRAVEGTFPPHLLPALLLAPFFARSSTLVLRSLLRNRTEKLATQAIFFSDVTFIALPVPLHGRRTYFFPSSRLD